MYEKKEPSQLEELAKEACRRAGVSEQKAARDAEAVMRIAETIGFGGPWADAVRADMNAFIKEQREAIGRCKQAIAAAEQQAREVSANATILADALFCFDDPLAQNITALQKVMIREYSRAGVSPDESARAVSYTLWAYCAAFGASPLPPDIEEVGRLCEERTKEQPKRI